MHMTSRRTFLSGLASSCVAASGGSLWAGDARKCRLTFGVVSDIHLRYEAKALEKAFRRFDAELCDGVVIAGDLADSGLLSQLKLLAATWNKVFPGDRSAATGRPVERLFVLGNHDYEGVKYGYAAHLREKGIDIDPDIMARMGFAKAWKEAFGEEFAPIWKKSVRGFAFYGAHWLDGRASPAGLKEFFEREAPGIDRSRPFFYVQHAHPKGTCYGKAAWGVDNGVSTKILSAFPNAVAFSGHSHCTLADERSVWQGAFTSIGASSMRYIGRGYRGEGSSFTVAKSGPGCFLTRDGNEGMVVRVYDGGLEVLRLDFVRDQELGLPWSIPLPAAKGSPFEFAARSRVLGTPAFAKGAAVGCECLKEGLLLRIPPAAAGTGRAFSYNVDGDGFRQMRFLSRTFYMPAGCDTMDTECLIPHGAIPAGLAALRVSPANCYGDAGEAMSVLLPGKDKEGT